MHPLVVRLLLVLAAQLALGCTIRTGPSYPDSSAKALRAQQWPQADGLFRKSERWLGADAAYTVDIGRGRILWLFGDTFVASATPGEREGSAMIHNSIAIQRGANPQSAQLHQYWGATPQGHPNAFFPGPGGEWYWPAHGIRVGSSLVVFLTRVRRAQNMLGFEVAGWTAVRIDNPDVSPSSWRVHTVPTPSINIPMIAGTSVIREGGWVYAYAVHEPGTHDVFVMRWPDWAFTRGDLRNPEWWVGNGWVQHAGLRGEPAPVMKNAMTEFSVTRHPRGGYLMVQSYGFPAGDIAVRYAQRLEGPWTEPTALFRPPESTQMDALVYAAKAHAPLQGGDIVVTYVASSLNPEGIMKRRSTYYPRFVRLSAGR